MWKIIVLCALVLVVKVSLEWFFFVIVEYSFFFKCIFLIESVAFFKIKNYIVLTLFVFFSVVLFFFFLTAKVEKEKESQLREMSSDLKIEIQMLKDKFKIMTKERDDLLVTVNQATDIQTTLKQENVDKEEILEIMETEKNKLEKEIGMSFKNEKKERSQCLTTFNQY